MLTWKNDFKLLFFLSCLIFLEKILVAIAEKRAEIQPYF